jgi:hypothetical protein
MGPIAKSDEDPAEATGASAPGGKRPVAVTLVGALALGVGAYHVVDGVIALINGGDASRLAEGAFVLALGVLAVVIGIGALRMKRWAWAAFMTWAVVGLTDELLRHFFYGNPTHLAMALQTVTVLVLTPLDVQIAFGVRPPRNVILTQNPVDSS